MSHFQKLTTTHLLHYWISILEINAEEITVFIVSLDLTSLNAKDENETLYARTHCKWYQYLSSTLRIQLEGIVFPVNYETQ